MGADAARKRTDSRRPGTPQGGLLSKWPVPSDPTLFRGRDKKWKPQRTFPGAFLPLWALIALLLLTPPKPSNAGPLFNLGPGLRATTVVQGIGSPMEICNVDSSRSLILTKDGRVFLFANGAVSTTPLINLASRSDFMVDGESGLMSCLATPQNVWLYYSTRTSQVFSRFTFDGSRLSASSEVILFGMENGGSAYHTGSALHWSANREQIFLARGDGALCDGDGNENCARIQDINSPYGKIFRIDRNGNGLPDNPFWTGNADDVASRVWAYGFRNPWSFMLAPDSDRLLIFDVGKNRREMVKIISRGSQGNWPCREGSLDHSSASLSWSGQPQPRKCTNLTAPVDLSTLLHEYDHNGQGGSIAGGAVMSPQQYRAPYAGRIVYADFVRGWVRHSNPGFTDSQDFGRASAIVRIKTGPSGRIWILSLDGDMIQEISDTNPPVAPPSPPPAPAPSPSPPPQDSTCALPSTGRNVVPSIEGTVYQPLMFASQPEIRWTCVSSSGLPCAADGRMDGNTPGRVRPMRMGGRRFSRGFGVRGNSTVTVPLDRRCGVLTLTVGVDDSSTAAGSTRFSIIRDGILAFRTTPLRRGGRRTLRVSIVGVTTLALVTTQTSAGVHNSMWANPILACGPSSPFIPRANAVPVSRQRFEAEPRQTVQVSATARDYLGRSLEVRSLFNWQLNIRHCQGNVCHSHVGQRYVRGAVRAWFQLPPHPDCVWYELQLTVTDRCGRRAWQFVTFSVPSKEAVCSGSGVGGRRALAGPRSSNMSIPEQDYTEDEEIVVD